MLVTCRRLRDGLPRATNGDPRDAQQTGIPKMPAKQCAATLPAMRRSSCPRGLWFLILTTLPQTSIAQDSVPHWIWSTSDRSTHQRAVFRHHLELPAGFRSARLIAVADFCRAKIVFNRQPLTVLEPYSAPQSIDISHMLRVGRNQITVEASSIDGPAAFALRLECQSAKTQQTLVTNGDWQWSAALTNDKPTQPANAVVSLGPVDSVWRLDNPPGVAISAVDDYTQWKRALGSDATSDPATFTVRDGFQIERLRSATQREGSWIALEFDPQGRLIIAREDRGLLRFTLSADNGESLMVESIEDSLKECRGLLYAADSLFVNANESKALFRMRDLDGSGRYQKPRLLYRTSGSTGHGRNNLALGPDGKIYSIHGDAVDLPAATRNHLSPFREHSRGQSTREGHLLRTDVDGGGWELLAAGLRNPFGIDFNADGEAFTYDADAEHDMGAPWYRPTRVVHLVSGADYGWRGVTGSWPPYDPDHPDNGLPNLDIGKGSPTSVQFGTHSQFPARWRNALFILDWAYGRILAVRMTPRGASYACRAEPFVQGRPLNVTGLSFGPDGAMYVVTGGRKTRSALYRIRYHAQHTEADAPRQTQQQQARIHFSQQARRLRKQLEQHHLACSEPGLALAWQHLDAPDPWIQHAARVAVEHCPVSMWQDKALSETRPRARLQALMALARSRQPEVDRKIIDRLNRIPLDALPTGELLTALHIYHLCLPEASELPDTLRKQSIQQLSALYSRPEPATNRVLAELLAALQWKDVVPATIAVLNGTRDPVEQLHYLRVLGRVHWGWSLATRRRYFEILNSATSVSGGAGMPQFLRSIRSDALKTLSKPEQQALADLLVEPNRQPATIRMPDRPLVKKWSLDDIPRMLQDESKIDVMQGRALFATLQCVHCHRLGTLGTARGPDLTSIARRFDRKAILQSIIAPSLVVPEAFRSDQITTTQGQVIIGRIIPELDFRSATLRIAPYPLGEANIVTLDKSAVEQHVKSPISIMPAGLLNSLTAVEIRNLIGFLESATGSSGSEQR